LQKKWGPGDWGGIRLSGGGGFTVERKAEGRAQVRPEGKSGKEFLLPGEKRRGDARSRVGKKERGLSFEGADDEIERGKELVYRGRRECRFKTTLRKKIDEGRGLPRKGKGGDRGKRVYLRKWGNLITPSDECD